MDLVLEIYELTKLLPAEEKYSLGDQMRRVAVSIPSNISEGQARNSNKEFANFLFIARGSRAELKTQLCICVLVGYLREEQTQKARLLIDEVGKMINGLINSMAER